MNKTKQRSLAVLFFRPYKAGYPIAYAGHGPTSLEPRPELCPREESNFDYKIRNLASYPLNDEGSSCGRVPFSAGLTLRDGRERHSATLLAD